jgi:uncharacterized protein YutE (UPF0331/DUF86 family)
LVDSDIIAQRLERLKIYLKMLRTIQKGGKKKVCKDAVHFAAMERYLQLAVECVLAVGNHIIAGLNLRKPSTYEQIIQILGDEKIITKKAMTLSRPVPSLRSLLVHDSSAINREKLFDVAKESLPAFEELAKAYQRFL